MKIKSTLFVLFISVTIAVAQKKITLNSKISFDMPGETVAFDDAEEIRRMKEMFGDKITHTLRKNTTVFKHKNIICRFRVVDNPPANIVQNSHKSLDNVYGKSTQTIDKSEEKLYKGYIKKSRNLGSGEVVYAVFQAAKQSVLKFTYYNTAKNVAFEGEMVSDANDREEVEQLFDQLCESLARI